MASFSGGSGLSGTGLSLPSVHGGGGDAEGSGWVGLLDDALESATQFVEFGAPFEFLPGIAALAPNIHPLLVHFPIAFLNAFFALDLIGVLFRRAGLRQVASWMLYLGAFGAVAAAGAGLFAASFVPHGAAVHEIMLWHERLGLTVTSLAAALFAWRLAARNRFSAMADAFHLALAGIMVTAMFFGADLGGFMVYQHGVGVKSLQQPEAEHHHSS